MSDLFNSIDELIFELEDEDSDPVGGRTIAIVPGAFKPPHLGHISMVKQYAEQADEVIILVSSPLKANRCILGKPCTARQAMEIWEMLLDDAGLGEPKVRVEKSSEPSPISAIYKKIGEEGDLEPGINLILGASTKKDKRGRPDWERWLGAAKYVKPGINLLSPEETAVTPTVRDNREEFRATDAREKLEQGENADEFFGAGRTENVRSILGLEPMEELSVMGAAGGGSIEGSAASADEEERKTLTREQNKKTKHPPYHELYLYKEVLKLLMKEGIIK